MGHYKNYPLNKILIPRDFFRVPESWGMYLFRYQLMWSLIPDRPKSSLGQKIKEVPYEKRLGYLVDYFKTFRKSVLHPVPESHREAFERFDSYQPIFETRGKYKRPRILILGTGGTALCKTDLDGFLKPQLSTEELIERMKRFNDLPQIDRWYDIIAEETEEKIDSAEMTPGKQYGIACRVCDEIHEHKPDGVVVWHGTDTMANTAQAWSFLIEDLSVPIVLTGAMIPGERDDSDVFQNLVDSCFYSSVAPIRPGVYICFSKELYEGPRVIHDATDPFKAFNIIMSGGMRVREIETLRGSSGKFHDFGKKEEIEKVLGNYLAYREIGKEQWSSLTLAPRIIDRSLSIPADTKKDSPKEMYEYVKKSLGAGIKFPSYDLNRKTTIRLGKERSPVFSFNVQPDSPIDILLGRLFEEDIRRLTGRRLLRRFVGVKYLSWLAGGKTLNELSIDEASKLSLPLEKRYGLYTEGYSGTVAQTEDLIKLMLLGVPVIFGTRMRGDRVKNYVAGPETVYYTHGPLRGEKIRDFVIHPEDTVKETAVTKLGIAMAELNRRIKEEGRTDLETPTKYLGIPKRIMSTNFVGEIEGEQSPKTLFDVIEETVKRQKITPLTP